MHLFAISCSFRGHLIFLIFKNQSAARNVIQLIEKGKTYLDHNTM